MSDNHDFGGNWTDRKLNVLRQYLIFFTTALRKQRFELIYIDGFAGSGGRMVEKIISHASPMFGMPGHSERIDVPGSARIALETTPPFDRMILIERHGKRFAALQQLCARYPKVQVEPLQGETNQALVHLCGTTPWRIVSNERRGIRAVLFLDPYGMNLEFSTLEAIAATKAIDVWYLFPLSGVYRQAARSGTKLTPAKRSAITRILGTGDWDAEFYPATYKNDMFGGTPEALRTADVTAIETYVHRRLKAVFPTVTEPMRLCMDNGTPLYSLFFAVSNPDPKAIGLARRGANHILKAGISSQVRPRN